MAKADRFQAPSLFDLLQRANSVLEFLIRWIFVNLPTYLLANFPELDRISIVVMAYFLLQVVGLCWGVLLNAGFSLACRITGVLPYLSTGPLFTSGNADGEFTTSVSVQMISTFYVSYASVRSVIGFASSIFNLALDSINNFPKSTASIVKRGKYVLQTSEWCFLPPLLLLLGLAGSDYMCGEFSNGGGTRELMSIAMGIRNNITTDMGAESCGSSSPYYEPSRSWPEYAALLHDTVQRGTRSSRIAMCNHSGYYFLTSRYEQSRRLVFYTLLIMVVQLWQVYLYQFPHWNLALKTAHPVKRVALQASVMALFTISMICAYLVFCCDIKVSHVEELVCLVLLGWTLWLFFFVPVLADAHGDRWLMRLSQERLQQFASYIRVSHTCLLGLMFAALCWRSGLLQARMDLTFITIMVPTLYCSVFLMASMYMNANALLVGIGAPFALLAALVITIYLAKAGGDGGFLLVFFHILVKWTEFFGGGDDDDDNGDDDDESGEAEQSESTVPTSRSGHSSSARRSRSSRDRLLGAQQGGAEKAYLRYLEKEDTTTSDTSAQRPVGGSQEELSPGRYRFYSVYANNKRPVSPETTYTGCSSASTGSQVPDADEKTCVGGDKEAEIEEKGSSFTVGLVETEWSVEDDHAEREVGLSDLEDWRHVRSRVSSVAGTPQKSAIEAEFVHGSFRQSVQRRHNRSGSIDSVVGGGVPSSPLDRAEYEAVARKNTSNGLVFPAVSSEERGSGEDMRGNRPRAWSSLDDSDIPVYVPSRAEWSQYHTLRTTKSADYLPSGEEDGGSLDGGSPALGGMMKDTSYAALQLLERRGEEDSALVKIDLPKALKTHWIRKVTKKNLTIVGRVARSISTTDTFVSGVLRAFACLGVILTLMLATIAIAAYVQKQFAIFPQLIDFRHDEKAGVMHFDHVVANVTLHTTPLGRGDSWAAQKTEKGRDPHYSVCSWRWNGLSALDFALLSEAAYFDDDGNGNIQGMVNSLFPGRNFTVRASHSPMMRLGAGPRFIEVSGTRGEDGRGFTVLAVRGTDVGKFHDLMEDFMLYSEPIIFALLSTVFPTIRIWTHETTAHIIEWLYEFNSFFGLQGEAEYYGKLTTRVLEITNVEGTDGHDVFITGHSLGGGLARIVGTLTGQGSVSFSPPGLGLSYRKYQLPETRGNSGHQAAKEDRAHRMMRPSEPVKRGQMHYQSLAIIPEYDVFPQIDEQVGNVQHIQCDHENSFFCHLMEGTICHLLSHCGDSDSTRFHRCESSIDFGVVAPSILSFMWTVRFVAGPLLLLALSIFLLAVLPDMI